MGTITLKNTTPDGKEISATFHPEKGMNLVSFKRGDCEVIDQQTHPLFEERCAGLGALIGPHFHRRNPLTVPKVENESLFPHIEKVKAKGVQDPFSHGIARYAPWKAEATEQEVTATLSGKDEWQGVPLKDLEGQHFEIVFNAKLLPETLSLNLSITSDSDSLLGLHYYYALPQGSGSVQSQIRGEYMDQGEVHPIPDSWSVDSKGHLNFNLNQEADYGLRPLPHQNSAEIVLDAGTYRLKTHYYSDHDENSWQLYHPKDASFVCIEPLTAANPRKPCLTASILRVDLTLEA